jgi:ribosomal subunit interface protein
MEVPLELAFRNMEHSDAIEELVREKAAHLDKLFDRLTSCRVTVEAPHKHHRKGNQYHVQIFLGVPQGQLVVSRDPGDVYAHEDLRVAIRDAFQAAERQLKEHAEKMRGDVKAHVPPLQGTITRLFPDQDYGFIATTDGREIFFHRNAVVDYDFDDLEKGQPVELAVWTGDSEIGPHASTVRPIGSMEYNPERDMTPR